ncbi:hypothetical protein ANCDUO_26767 [Ancylostoma duodenale]|uniref:Serine-threonine/tyrosine-protein kinase catalytic domain-containing protein n=1 Tax=Ancylostoma duodenale TaxID=51022 RepID=A0A0C2C0U1_9BILA|nr:hypothetical protein ANCDUO_26767 [Ancylostoma duodenale]
MVSKIGSGNFGEVWAGSMKESQNKPPIDVAIKVVRFICVAKLHFSIAVSSRKLKMQLSV